MKFQQLRRSAPGRSRVVKTLREMSPETAKVELIHKRYMTVAKMIDLLVEPLVHEAGSSLYARARHVALTNLHYYGVPVIIGQALDDALLTAFVAMCRHPSSATIQAFYGLAERISTLLPPSARGLTDHLEVILASKRIAEKWTASEAGRDELDPAIPALVDIAEAWNRTLANSFVLVHDESSVVLRWVPMLERLAREDAEAVEYLTPSGPVRLPLRLAGVEMVSSASSLGVQVADLLAGAAAYLAKATMTPSMKGDAFARALMELPLLPLIHNAVWPSPDFELSDADLESDPATLTARVMFGGDRPNATPQDNAGP